ncbi:MAG: hypothetical protein ACE5HO_10215 [bacterium]
MSAMMVLRCFGLLTNDALSVAMVRRLRAKTFAYADKLFLSVQGLLVYVPDHLER